MKVDIKRSAFNLFAGCALVVILAGCSGLASPFLGGQPTDQQTATAPVLLPNYAKGSWYAYNDGSRDVVVEVAGEAIIWQDEKGRMETRYRNPILPRLKWPRGETKVLADPDALWPLRPGNTVRFHEIRNEFDLARRLTERKTRTWRCKVGDSTVLSTDAGSFDTYPLVCELRSRGRANRLLGTRIWYYAPEVGHYVRREKIDKVGTIEIRELVAHG